jgi:hypothetical protein
VREEEGGGDGEENCVHNGEGKGQRKKQRWESRDMIMLPWGLVQISIAGMRSVFGRLGPWWRRQRNERSPGYLVVTMVCVLVSK